MVDKEGMGSVGDFGCGSVLGVSFRARYCWLCDRNGFWFLTSYAANSRLLSLGKSGAKNQMKPVYQRYLAITTIVVIVLVILVVLVPPVLWCCWLGGRKGIRPVKTEQWGAGVLICLEQGADLHMAQRISLPLTVSCFSKIQMVLPFWYRPTRVVLDKGPLNVCVKRVCVLVVKGMVSFVSWEVSKGCANGYVSHPQCWQCQCLSHRRRLLTSSVYNCTPRNGLRGRGAPPEVAQQ